MSEQLARNRRLRDEVEGILDDLAQDLAGLARRYSTEAEIERVLRFSRNRIVEVIEREQSHAVQEPRAENPDASRRA